MIEKERLQELLEQEAYIWVLYGKDIVKMCSLDVPSAWKKHDCYKLKDLYETQEEAEWVAKMHTEYTEHFNPPLFENLPYEYSFKFIRNGVEHELFCKRDSYIIVISCCKDYMSGTEDMDYTKENYIKAVEIAYKLFKGENEDEKETN